MREVSMPLGIERGYFLLKINLEYFLIRSKIRLEYSCYLSVKQCDQMTD